MSPEERLQLVDAAGRPTGAAPRSACHGDPSLLHAVVHVMVTNAAGAVLLQLRSAAKDVQPNRWDTAVGGHVAPGEAVADALVRETREELGATVPPEAFVPCYTYLHRNAVESEFVHTHALRHEGPFRAPPEEIADLRWWTTDAIRAALGTGAFTPNFEEEFARFLAWRDAPPPSPGGGEG